MICLLPAEREQVASVIGLDLGPIGSRTANEVVVSLRVVRVAGDQRKVVGVFLYQVDTIRACLPTTTLQMIDPNPPQGPCRYTIEAQSETGDGIFYFSQGVRLAAWEL
jgi:hypothetical protein